MCGRYALHGPQSRLREGFLLEFCPEYFARYNVAAQSDAWLDPGNSDAGSLQAMAGPCSRESMCASPVSPAINRGDDEGLECIAPVTV